MPNNKVETNYTKSTKCNIIDIFMFIILIILNF